MPNSGSYQVTSKSLEGLERDLGRFHPETIRTLLVLGHQRYQQDHLPEALEYYVDARKRIEAALDEAHPLWIDLFAGMGQVYAKQDLLREASAFFRKALTVIKLEEDEVAPERKLDTVVGYAKILARQRKYEDARDQFDRALAIVRSLSSPSPVVMVAVLAEMGHLNFDHGYFERAISYFEEAAFFLKEHQVDDEQLQQELLHMLTLAYRNSGKSSQAISLQVEILENQRAQNPENVPHVVEVLQKLIEVHQEGQNYDQAEKLHHELIELCQVHYGPKSVEAAKAEEELGTFYCTIGRFPEAKNTLNSSLSTYINGVGDRHPSLTNVLHNLGTVSLLEGAYAEAELFLGRALEQYQARNDSPKPEIARTLIALSAVFKQRGEIEQSRELLQQAIGFATEAPEEVAMASEILAELGGTTQIIELGTGAREGSDVKALPDNLQSVGQLFHRGLEGMSQGKYAEAARAFEQILRILENEQGESHPDLVPVLHHIAEAYRQIGLMDRARDASDRASRLQQAL